MSITITQTCDACGKHRTLKTASDSRNGGWRLIEGNRSRTELCSTCIDALIEVIPQFIKKT